MPGGQSAPLIRWQRTGPASRRRFGRDDLDADSRPPFPEGMAEATLPQRLSETHTLVHVVSWEASKGQGGWGVRSAEGGSE
jgi:hypothetical protein